MLATVDPTVKNDGQLTTEQLIKVQNFQNHSMERVMEV